MSFVVEVIKPQGILDATKTAEFRQKVNESINSGAKIILIDFSNVTFMDSSGLGALVFSLKTVRAAGAQLFLCSINEQIKILFELTSLDQVFQIVTDRSELERNFQ
jgi:anti-sigma B factor antagonist